MEFKSHVAISLNGMLADWKGNPAWDAAIPYSPAEHGHDEFTADASAVVLGRTSFDQGWPFWKDGAWPYAGRQVYILTSRPLPDGAELYGIRASSGGVDGLVEELKSEVTSGFVHVLGGAQTIRAFIDQGATTSLTVVVLPIIIPRGIPLFPTKPVKFSNEAWLDSLKNEGGSLGGFPVELIASRAFPSGAIELTFAT
jgi:dihydrofolate reductase